MFGDGWERYWKEGYSKVEGWTGGGVRGPLEVIATLHRDRAITGSILEIGVHHGKFFIPLALLSDPATERCIAIDVFEDQSKNIDGSGLGSRDIFLANVAQWCPDRRIECMQADSLALTVADRVRLVQEFGAVRIASIDGGHTPEHTVNDLLLVQDICTGGGVVILDDYYNAHWPGVHEGVARFFLHGTPKLKPFAYSGNKLYLADFTHADTYFRSFYEVYKGVPNFKHVKMYGSSVAVF